MAREIHRVVKDPQDIDGSGVPVLDTEEYQVTSLMAHARDAKRAQALHEIFARLRAGYIGTVHQSFKCACQSLLVTARLPVAEPDRGPAQDFAKVCFRRLG